LADKEAAEKISNGQAIGASNFINVIGGEPMPGTRHILHYEVSISGSVSAHVACKRAGIDIKAAAGRRSDDDTDRLTLKKIHLSRKQKGGQDKKRKHHRIKP
jgi:hypothetical protein